LRLVPDFSRPMRVPRPAAGRMTETFMVALRLYLFSWDVYV
jgi:hypothetical protein